MNKSDSIAALAGALSKLQGEINDVAPNNKGHKHEYADLCAMLKVARPLLSKHELALTQLIGNADDKVTVESVLMHSSGEWISSSISVPSGAGNQSMNALQAVGSAISYARRYSLAAMLNYTKGDDDDDGNVHTVEKKQTLPPAKPLPSGPMHEPLPGSAQLINKDQEFALSKLMFETKSNSVEFNKYYGVKSFSQLTEAQYAHALDKLNEKVAAMKKTAQDYLNA